MGVGAAGVSMNSKSSDASDADLDIMKNSVDFNHGVRVSKISAR